MRQRRAIGIVRVSQYRDGESPAEQRDRITAACERDGLELVAVHDELDVSGATPLAQRDGLRRAVEAVEAGEADVVVAAYFDRLVRSLRVQDELVTRVEAADGRVLALDTGEVTNGSAGQWLSATMLGAVSEYYRRSIRERSAEAQRRAIARGVPPWARVTPGYCKLADGRYEPDPVTAPIVAEAFRMRAEGATVAEVRMFLRDHGIGLTYTGVVALLRSTVVLDEIHFGSYEPNLAAHEAIVDRHVWAEVHRIKVPRGRRPKSERLLARLGVLRCGMCGRPMNLSTGNARNGRYRLYRCSSKPGDQPRHTVTISADVVEGVVIDAVKIATADVEGRASAGRNAQDAEVALEAAQRQLDA
jgi:DNA invertase Pin-like site-specific DNA recombinase